MMFYVHPFFKRYSMLKFSLRMLSFFEDMLTFGGAGTLFINF